jgi:hypothetical protein
VERSQFSIPDINIANMSSMEYFPIIDEAEVQMYQQLRRKILAEQAKQQAGQMEGKINIEVALSELKGEASVDKPRRKWHGFSLKRGNKDAQQNYQQGLRSVEPYTYQGTRGYGKLAARKAQ